MSQKIIIANWKMNFGVKQTAKFIKQLEGKIKNTHSTSSGQAKLKGEVVICASFTALNAAGKLLKKTNLAYRQAGIALGAQNVGQAPSGTWTGEVSAIMLKEVGCKYVIIGHSERRQKLGETDEQVNAKVKLVLENNMIPILCVGETRGQRKKKLTKKIIAGQVKKGLDKIKIDKNQKLIVAYEPVWAISDGKHPAAIPTIKEIEQVHKLILNILTKKYSAVKVKKSCQVIYGGSVSSKNAAELFASDYINGGLVGGASLKVGEFARIIS